MGFMVPRALSHVWDYMRFTPYMISGLSLDFQLYTFRCHIFHDLYFRMIIIFVRIKKQVKEEPVEMSWRNINPRDQSQNYQKRFNHSGNIYKIRDAKNPTIEAL